MMLRMMMIGGWRHEKKQKQKAESRRILPTATESSRSYLFNPLMAVTMLIVMTTLIPTRATCQRKKNEKEAEKKYRLVTILKLCNSLYCENFLPFSSA